MSNVPLYVIVLSNSSAALMMFHVQMQQQYLHPHYFPIVSNALVSLFRASWIITT